jgi:hypothetical protein
MASFSAFFLACSALFAASASLYTKALVSSELRWWLVRVGAG